MSAVTFFGVTADPDELRAIAELADARAPDLADRLATLHRGVLTPKTLADPAEIGPRLRAVAGFLERRQQGVPFGGPEWRESLDRLKAANERRRREHPERYVHRSRHG